MRFRGKQFLIALGLVAAALAPAARADTFDSGGGQTTVDLSDVKVIEHTGQQLPLDLSFIDEAGKPVLLRQYFTGRKPVILQLGYFQCPMLCSYVARGALDSLKQVSLNAGSDYEFVFVSIDPRETPALAAEKKQAYLQGYQRDGAGAGWHLLTGKQEQITQLSRAVGIQYKWVASAGQYAHPAVITLCMPDGPISRYLYGVRFDPQTLRLSLVETSNGKVGTTVDQFILTCFQWDGRQGKYAFTAMYIMRAGGVIAMIVVGVVLFRLFRREARQAKLAATTG